MKRIFMAIAAMTMLIATSCKESVNAPDDLVPGDGEFLVTIANAPRQEVPSDGKTVKTYINGNDIYWRIGDVISINGVNYETDKSDATVIFRLSEQEQYPAHRNFFNTYRAYYPADIAPTYDEEGKLLYEGKLPDTIQYNSFNLKNLPMYAESEDNVLTFHNICAAIGISVPEGCDKIVISANENLAGAFYVIGDGQDFAYRAVLSSEAEGMSKMVTVMPETSTFMGGGVFVAIPPGTYTGFTVKFFSGDNILRQRTLHSALTLRVNNIYSLKIDEKVRDDEFCFTAHSSCTLNFGQPSMLQYYTSGMDDWANFTSSGVQLSAGQAVYFRAAQSSYNLSEQQFSTINDNGTLTVSGNIMYLLDSTGSLTDFIDESSSDVYHNVYSNALNGLFKNMVNLVDASGLILPATTLAINCYSEMFWGCTSLTAVPVLPATTLAQGCYNAMFQGCTSLTTAPNLPATTLADWCYSYMFHGCTSLTAAPNLHATTLANDCYNSMFYGCTSLGVSTTNMGGTSLVVPSDVSGFMNWGESMFNGCTGFSGDPDAGVTYYFYDATPQPQN